MTKEEHVIVRDLQTMLGAVAEAKNQMRGQLWWRGHEDVTWELKPSVFRGHHHGDAERKSKIEENLAQLEAGAGGG